MNNKTELLKNSVIIDFETTGLDFRTAEVIEWGIATYDTDAWLSLSSLCTPTDPIDPEISAITNITDEMVAGFDSFDKQITIFDFLSTKYTSGFFVAHNSFYDSKILANYKNYPNEWICTMRMAKKLFGDDPTVTKFTLSYLRYRFKLAVPEQYLAGAHRAEADACVTSLLFEFLIDEMEKRGILDLSQPYEEQIIDWLAAPIIYTVMTFGKHKGIPMKDVPKSYWKWAMENMKSLDENEDEYDVDFATSIAVALGAKLNGVSS